MITICKLLSSFCFESFISVCLKAEITLRSTRVVLGKKVTVAHGSTKRPRFRLLTHVRIQALLN